MTKTEKVDLFKHMKTDTKDLLEIIDEMDEKMKLLRYIYGYVAGSTDVTEIEYGRLRKPIRTYEKHVGEVIKSFEKIQKTLLYVMHVTEKEEKRREQIPLLKCRE